MTHQGLEGVLGEEGESLGTGLAFLSDWDFEVVNGSMDLITGIAVLGRDIAWAFGRQLDDVRGDLLNADKREEIRIDVKDILDGESRVADYTIKDVRQTDDAPRRVEVVVELTAETDEQAEFIFRN